MRSAHARWLLVGLFFVTGAYALAENITLTTYYPSPRGVYQQLRATTEMDINAAPSSPRNPAAPVPNLLVGGATYFNLVGGNCPAGTVWEDLNGDGARNNGECHQALLQVDTGGNITLSGSGAVPTPRTIAMGPNATAASAGNPLTIQAGSPTTSPSPSNRAGGTLNLSSGTSTGNQGGDIQFLTATPGASGSTQRTPDPANPKMIIKGNGNVGIGTMTPADLLSVAGDAAIGGPPGPTASPVTPRTLRVVGSVEVLRGGTSGPIIALGQNNIRGDSNAATIFLEPTDGSFHIDPLGRSDLTNTDDLILMRSTGVGTVNMGLGAVPRTTPSPANNQNTGNLDVNDVFLRAANNGVGRWASQTGIVFPNNNVLPRSIAGNNNAGNPNANLDASGRINLTQYGVPRTARAVIISGEGLGNQNPPACQMYVGVRLVNAVGPVLTDFVLHAVTAGGINQVIAPIYSDGSIEYQVSGCNVYWGIDLLGWFE